MKVEYKKILIRFLILVVIIATVQNYMLNTADIATEPNMGYYNYFNIQSSGREILYTILLVVLIPSLLLMHYYDDYHHKHDNLCILRIGYKKYYVRAMLQILVITFLLRLIVEVIFVLNIHFFNSAFNFTADENTFLLFGNDTFVNLIIYLFTASIGTGVLSCLWFSIIYFIKNKYVYRGILVFWNILSVYYYMIVHSLAVLFFEDSYFLRSITLGVAHTSLIGPGTRFESYGLVNFISSMVFGILLTVLFMTLSFRKKYKYG